LGDACVIAAVEVAMRMLAINIGTLAAIGPALLMTFTVASGQTQVLHGNDSVFFTGNDVYSWCQNNRSAAEAYTAGLADGAAHSSLVIDATRRSTHDAGVDLALVLISNYCIPKTVILNQVTDVFCNYLRDEPQKRDGVGPIIFNDAMHKAWPCKGP